MAYVPLVAIQQGPEMGQATTPARATVNRGNVPPMPIEGDVFWVDSNAPATGANGSYNKPHVTIDAAHNLCITGNNDVIYVKNGHAETLSNATSLVLDLADVTIIGLGKGLNRPVITMDTATTTTIPVSAANVTVQNLIFNANFADIAVVFTLTTAVSFAVLDCRFKPDAATMNFVDIVLTNTSANAADDLAIARCEWIDSDTGTGTLVNVDADIDGFTVMDCIIDLGINGVLSAVFEVIAGADTTNINIRNNDLRRMVTGSAVQLGTWADTTTTNTGVCANNKTRCVDTADELMCTAGSNVSFYQNESSSVAGSGGYTLPVHDA